MAGHLLSRPPSSALFARREAWNGLIPDVTLWGLFVVASEMLLLTPGPAALFIVACSIEKGRVLVLGIHLGTILHILAAAVGLSAFRRRSPLRSSSVSAPPEAVGAAEQLRRVVCVGFLVNLFNPKSTIACLAFLPQFVDPTRGALQWQIFALGFTFMGLGIVADGMFALAVGAPGDLLRRNRRFLHFRRWFAGCTGASNGAKNQVMGPRIKTDLSPRQAAQSKPDAGSRLRMTSLAAGIARCLAFCAALAVPVRAYAQECLASPIRPSAISEFSPASLKASPNLR